MDLPGIERVNFKGASRPLFWNNKSSFTLAKVRGVTTLSGIDKEFEKIRLLLSSVDSNNQEDIPIEAFEAVLDIIVVALETGAEVTKEPNKITRDELYNSIGTKEITELTARSLVVWATYKPVVEEDESLPGKN